MHGKKFIQTLKLSDFLSFGDNTQSIGLEPLNVLIGPNSSGKSNLIAAIGLLQATPKDIAVPIREGGGVYEWLWKGAKTSPHASIEATIYNPDNPMALRYKLSFTMVGQRFQLVDEAVENEHGIGDTDHVDSYYRYEKGFPIISIRESNLDRDMNKHVNGRKRRTSLRKLMPGDLDLDQSVLSQRKDPDRYPELTFLGNSFSKIRLYREWNLGRYTPPRLPQKADLPEDFLLDDASNLGLVLNDLQHQAGMRQSILAALKRFNERIEDLTTRVHGGTIQINLHERGLHHPIPATRLSDGTLRFICLLAILAHPTPPPLICIEEPELGMHPDVLPLIAELLLDASQRTQLIVTTHSDALVSELTDHPETVLVCEGTDQGTQLRRLEKEQLREWLEKYSLGELWRMGEIGGNP